MELLAIPLGFQPKNFWPGTRKTTTKWLVISSTLSWRKAPYPTFPRKREKGRTRKTIVNPCGRGGKREKQSSIPAPHSGRHVRRGRFLGHRAVAQTARL